MLVVVAGYEVPVSKMSYVDLAKQLPRELKDTNQRSEVQRCKVADRDWKSKELYSEVLLLAAGSKNVVRLQEQVTV